jgi:hypothetical protein
MSKINVLWTTEEKEVAVKVVFPYLINGMANGWWDEMNLIVWGPSVRLVLNDPEIEALLTEVMESNVTVEACRLCTDLYGATGFFQEMGATVRYVGPTLTASIKAGEKVITF